MGMAKNRGILMERDVCRGAVDAGGDILIMRHPRSNQTTKEMIVDLAS